MPGSASSDPGHDRELVRAAEDDVRLLGERPHDRRGGLVRPEPTTQVDVEADRQVGLVGELDRAHHGVARGAREGRRDAGEVQPAGIGEEAVGRGPVHILDGETRPGRPRPRVDDLRRPEHPSFPEHDPGGRGRIDGQVPDIDAFGAQATDDGDTEPVAPDATDVRDRLAEPRQSDRDVRLGAGDVPLEGGGLGERARLLGDERDQALPEGDDRGGHAARPGCGVRPPPARAAATTSTT